MNLGQAHGTLGEYERARPLLDDALGSFRGQGDRVHTAEVLRRLGSLAVLEGNYPEAGARLLQSLALSLELGDRPSAGLCLLWRAFLAWRLTDLAQAQALYAASLTLFREMHDRYLMAWAVYGLGLAAGQDCWSGRASVRRGGGYAGNARRGA
jgi:tetratricopeptide (TPR) repeat protein